MNRKITANPYLLPALAFSLLVSPLAGAITYEPSALGQTNVTDTENPNQMSTEDLAPPSFLDSLQKTEAGKKKTDFLNVLDLLKTGKLKEGKAKIAALIQEHPNVPEFYNLQALSEVLDKNPKAAQQSYQKALAINPSNTLALLGLSQLHFAAGELDQAHRYARQVLTINDKNINAYRLLAGIAAKRNQPDEYESVLLSALEKSKGDITLEKAIITDLIKLYGSQKKPEKGLVLGEDLLKRHPNHSQALSVLAIAQLAANKNDLAERTLRQLIGQEKKDALSRLLLAQLLMAKPGQEQEILRLLDEAIAADTQNPQALTLKTAYLIQLKRFPEAFAVANKAEILFPTLALGKALQGSIYLAEKKLDSALDSFQHAYSRQPNDKLLFVIADLLAAQDKLPQALTTLNQALEKSPKNNAIHFKLATLYQQHNEPEKAERHYLAILAEQPDNALVLNNLAWLYVQQNNPKALEIAKRAYEKAPESAAIADTYGLALVRQGRHKEGLAMLEKATQLDPAAPDIQFHLAQAHVANGNTSKAITLLEKLTKAEQDFPDKKAAVALLAQLQAR